MTSSNILIAIVAGKAYRFADAAAAAEYGNGLRFFTSAEDLTVASDLGSPREVSTKEMIAIHNELAEKPVNKFSDRMTAAKRTWAEINSKVPVTEKKAPDMSDVNNAVAAAATNTKLSAEEKKKLAEAKAAKKQADKDAKAKEKADAKAKKAAEKEAAKAANPSGDRGRKSALSGKVLRHKIVKNAEGDIKNPRKAGSHGERSLQIIIDAGDAGISTEGYLNAGGRMNDLHWDIDHGNVVASDPVAAAAGDQTTTTA